MTVTGAPNCATQHERKWAVVYSVVLSGMGIAGEERPMALGRRQQADQVDMDSVKALCGHRYGL